MSNFQGEINEQRQFKQFATKLAEARNLSESEAIVLAASQVEQVGSQYDGLPFDECVRYAEQQAFKDGEESGSKLI